MNIANMPRWTLTCYLERTEMASAASPAIPRERIAARRPLGSLLPDASQRTVRLIEVTGRAGTTQNGMETVDSMVFVM